MDRLSIIFSDSLCWETNQVESCGWCSWVSYLSEDEGGGGGAAVRPLQPAASGVRPSVSLVRTEHTQIKSSFLFSLHLCSIFTLDSLPHWLKGTFPPAAPSDPSLADPRGLTGAAGSFQLPLVLCEDLIVWSHSVIAPYQKSIAHFFSHGHNSAALIPFAWPTFTRSLFVSVLEEPMRQHCTWDAKGGGAKYDERPLSFSNAACVESYPPVTLQSIWSNWRLPTPPKNPENTLLQIELFI